MVDDSMEISSDHGHGPADDDIDIDIDLTAEPTDEDYVLEDATSMTEDDTSHGQYRAALGTDDIMVDEIVAVYEPNDLDLTDAVERQHSGEEVVEMLSFNFEEPQVDHTENTKALEVTDPSHAEVQGELSWEEEEHTQLEEVKEDDASYDVGISLQNGAEHKDPQGDENTGALLTAENDRDSRTVTPQAASPQEATADQPRRPSESSLERVIGTRASSHDLDTGHALGTTSNGTAAEVEHGVIVGETETQSLVLGVSVGYRSGDYALFGIEDSDDPDSFFLSDNTISEQPIVELFKSLRDVIHEDLAADDELCLLVQDLGLEIEETVSSLYEITLLQLCELREKLLLNDGIGSPPPLRLILGTRRSFAVSLANLMAGADDGKGLSQLATWDGESEDIFDNDETTEESENVKPYDLSLQDSVPSIGIKDDTRATEPDSVVTAKLSNITGDDVQEAQKSTNESSLTTTDTISPSVKRETRPLSELDAQLSNTSEIIKKDIDYSGDIDEDGDIIDYSEEETEDTTYSQLDNDNGEGNGTTEIPQEVQTQTSSTPAAINNSHNQSDGVNIESIGNEEQWEEDEGNETHEYLEDDATDRFPEPEQHYEYSEKVYPAGTASASNHGNELDYGRNDYTGEDEPREVEHEYERRTHSETEESEYRSVQAAVSHGQSTELGDSQVEVSDGVSSHPSNSQHQPPAGLDGSLEHTGNDYDESFIEIRDQSLNQSFEKQVDQDEIGYEDDENDETVARVISLPEADTKLLQSDSGSGKRARSDADPDEAAVLKNKDAKRPRS